MSDCICKPGHMGDPDCEEECCGVAPAKCLHPEEAQHFTYSAGQYDRYVCRLCSTILYSDGTGRLVGRTP